MVSRLAALACALFAAGAVSASEPVDYLRDIKPIFGTHCTSCHGALRQKGGLRLDAAQLIRRGGDEGPVVLPGNSSGSMLLQRVLGAGGVRRMPPKDEGEALSTGQIALLKEWIDRGAQAPPDEPAPDDARQHWAFQRPLRQAQGGPVKSPLATEGTRTPQNVPANPIDALLATAQQRQGLEASPAVSKELWLRRVYLDLIGLPPTREQLHAFRNDDSPDAWERTVDQLLTSPHYGVRWGRHWMDIWRYSDWFGLGQELRFSHPHLWRWRDWIVEALNTDKGYDQMIVEMLAGDELAPLDPETLRATGFLARNWYIFNRNVILDQVVEHAGRGFLGLTLQCARCHDHKFDPITQSEYYQIRAFLEPHHVRIDRVPGEPDRNKAGLARVYDAFLDAPTYLFERGDEAHPRKQEPLAPAVPAIFKTRPITISPVRLPLPARAPDKQVFVIEETRAAAQQAVAQARLALTTARQNVEKTARTRQTALAADQQALSKLPGLTDKPEERKTAQAAAAQAAEQLAKATRAATDAPAELELAQARLALAEARHASLEALLRVEQIEDAPDQPPALALWTQAALDAHLAQQQLALREAQENHLHTRQACDQAQATLDGLILAAGRHKENKPLNEASQKAAADLVDARSKLAKAEEQLASARQAAAKSAGTNYSPRPLAYPRAATYYKETPPNEPYPPASSGRRLALARWISDPSHPLTARVAVNHIWARHFGEPLVSPVFDFGLRAKKPVLHELLDWLAVDFMESGWSMKRLHRQIVLSQAYRMTSSGGPAEPANTRIDPDNHFFWRMNTRRMESELVRDTLLHLAGKLDPTQGGPDLPVSSAEAGLRRTLYYRYARDDRMRFLTFFDAPSVEECYRRHETIVPQQALVMANSKIVLTRAAEVAARIRRENNLSPLPNAFVTAAFENILGRAPTTTEVAECEQALAALADTFAAEPVADRPHQAQASLVHVLLNHNDFITIR